MEYKEIPYVKYNHQLFNNHYFVTPTSNENNLFIYNLILLYLFITQTPEREIKT